jgi:beta-1,4-mannosyltransferase
MARSGRSIALSSIRSIDPMRISAWPGLSIGRDNPYTKLLYEAVQSFCVEVEDFSPWKALWRRYDIFHAHWPEYYVVHPNPMKAVLGTVGVLSCMCWMRLRGTRVVWTVHNLRSHNFPRPRLERLYWRLFPRLVDGFVALTPAGRDQAREHFPRLRNLPGFVMPLGNYVDAYPNDITREDARRRLEVDQHQPMVLFIGIIAKYKNVPGLARAFRGVPDQEARLVIAGRFNSDEDEASTRQSAEGDSRIRIDSGYVDANDLQVYLNAADLVVLPFREILNSASALLALAFGRPVLVPALGAMPELQATFGVDWVRLYEGEMSPDILMAALAWSRQPNKSTLRHAASLEWAEIGRKTVEAYRAIREQSGVRGGGHS